VKIYAHTLAGRPQSDWELLEKHLSEVGAAASANAAPFGAEDWATILGHCHDLGKASDDFQQYLRASNPRDAQDAGAEDSSLKRVNHSTFGARYVAKAMGGIAGQMLAFCVAGHHGGLPNESSSDDGKQTGTLRVRLDESISIPRVSDPELALIAPVVPWSPSSSQDVAFQLAFFTRMLFSCLVDGDRACTEAFCSPEQSEERRQPRPSLHAMRERIMAHLAELQKGALDTQVNLLRQEVLKHCRMAANSNPGFFSLQVPTGGGKTLSSLAFALEHAALHSHRRVVVAIPFTSIIEQTADVYRKALGLLSARALVEHHTNLQPIHDTRANQFATENWDAPLIVTTNVQLLESLFAAATSPCRKLHRLARSVIILDKAQTLPVELLEPTLAALRELVLNYGCTVVLCTATQPALERRSDFPLGLEGVRPIIADPLRLFRTLKRVEVRHVGPLGDDKLAGLLREQPRALCIVNTRRHAARLFDALSAVCEEGSCFHLSTLMCGKHRRKMLQQIRALAKIGPCRVVSTQLIEAGVDLDLPVVYRAAAGFDSIAQAAGRCNREGLLPIGYTYVFDAAELPPPGLLRDGAQVARELFSHFPDPLLPEAIEAYFRQYYWKQRDRWDFKKILQMMRIDPVRKRALFQFRDIAEAYKLIRDPQFPILVPYDPESESFSRALLGGDVEFLPVRQLQPYLVSVPERTLRGMEASGMVQAHSSGIHVLLRKDAYTDAKGLTLETLGLDQSLWGV
jgi:CRISPR-associated endonuclease/helicase Cas3